RGIQSLFAGFPAAAVVNNQSKTDRNIFVLEYRKRLLSLVFKNPEIFPIQVADGMVLLIGDIHMQFGEIDIHIELEIIVFLREQKGSNQQIYKGKSLYLHKSTKSRAL